MSDQKNQGYLLKHLDKLENSLEKVDTKCDNIDKSVAFMSARFEDHIKQDEKMYEEFKRMNDILQSNTESLKEHMHRTGLLEDLVTKIDARLAPIEQERLKKEAVREFMMEKAKRWGKIVAILGTIASLVYYIMKIRSGV